MSIAIGNSPISDFKIGTNSVSAVYVGTTQVWNNSPAPATNIPFYLEDVSGSANTVSITKSNASATTLTIETSADGQTWSTLGQTDTTPLDISVPANSKVYVRCNTNCWCNPSGNYNKISIATGNFRVGGNIMSLLYGSNFTGQETAFPDGSVFIFYFLFFNNSHLTDASSLLLPATALNQYCYQNMFSNCSSLTTAPATLPATTLVDSCYQNMFRGCSSLTTAPALPATTLASNCYTQMFMNCSSLTQAPALPATTLANYCYSSMFNGCSSLTQTPVLNATTLKSGCYQSMFRLCSLVNAITCLAEDISASNCTNGWVQNVSATGTFTKSPNMSGWGTGDSGIPSGWTVQDAQ